MDFVDFMDSIENTIEQIEEEGGDVDGLFSDLESHLKSSGITTISKAIPEVREFVGKRVYKDIVSDIVMDFEDYVFEKTGEFDLTDGQEAFIKLLKSKKK